MMDLDPGPIRTLEDDIKFFQGDSKAAEELLSKVERLTNDLVNDTLANKYCRRRTTVQGRLSELLKPLDALCVQVQRLNAQKNVSLEEAKLLVDECLCVMGGVADYYLFHQVVLRKSGSMVVRTVEGITNALKQLRSHMKQDDVKFISPAIDEVERIKETVTNTGHVGGGGNSAVDSGSLSNECQQEKLIEDTNPPILSSATFPVEKLPYYLQLARYRLTVDKVKQIPYSRYFTTVWKYIFHHLMDLSEVALHCIYLLNIHVAVDRLRKALSKKSVVHHKGDERAVLVARVFEDYSHRLRCHHDRLKCFNCACFTDGGHEDDRKSISV